MIPMIDERVDAYAADHTTEVPALLEEVAEVTRQKTTAPQMMVGRLEGAFLKMLVGLVGARRVVEVGTFTGYSGLWMASALPEDGELITCEISEEHASIARGFFEKSPDGGKIQLRLGPALETLQGLEDGSVDLTLSTQTRRATSPTTRRRSGSSVSGGSWSPTTSSGAGGSSTHGKSRIGPWWPSTRGSTATRGWRTSSSRFATG